MPVHQLRAAIDLCNRIVDQGLDFLCRSGRALGQVAHFAGDHRETAALLAGAGRFHCRIEREDIGLERDAVNNRNDVDDLLR
jgi:hypothetical protein